jgi:D-Tyr-tRNAtyr deacylase
MRALLQRVARAEVRVDGEVRRRDRPGLLILLGVAPPDDEFVAGDWPPRSPGCASSPTPRA